MAKKGDTSWNQTKMMLQQRTPTISSQEMIEKTKKDNKTNLHNE